VVVQGIDADLRRRLTGLLESVERRVPYCADLPPEERDRTMRLLRETRAEAQRAEPDRSRLAALLMGAAAAIRAVVSLRPAFEALKDLIESLGMKLPW
jgi:hypothetical protein